MSLRTQVLLLLGGVAALAIVVATGTLAYRFRTETNAEARARAEIARASLTDRGRSVAHNAALAAEQAVEAMDFLFLAELVQGTVSRDTDMLFGMICDQNGRVLVHSDPKQAGRTISLDPYKEATSSHKVMDRLTTVGTQKAVEVVAPIMVGGFLWGTLHFGLSLDSVDKASAEATAAAGVAMRRVIKAVGTVALGLLGLAALVTLVVTLGMTKPLRRLFADLEKIRGGDLQHRVRLSGCREFVTFGLGINELTYTSLDRDKTIEQNVQKLRDTLAESGRTSKQRDEFLANISHELRTPLNALLAVPRTLMNDYKEVDVWVCPKCKYQLEPEIWNPSESVACPNCSTQMRPEKGQAFRGDVTEHLHYIERISQVAGHMLGLVRSLIHYSQLMSAEVMPERAPVDMRELIGQVHDNVSNLANEKRIEVSFAKLTSPFIVQVDRTMMTQILYNLLGNAIKFTPEGGRVEVSVKAGQRNGQETVELSVQDTGIGMPAKELDQIFTAFYQIDGGHTRSHGGTGLGLSIARKMVELHGGRIWAQSDGPGMGSKFTFELPVGARQAAAMRRS